MGKPVSLFKSGGKPDLLGVLLKGNVVGVQEIVGAAAEVQPGEIPFLDQRRQLVPHVGRRLEVPLYAAEVVHQVPGALVESGLVAGGVGVQLDLVEIVGRAGKHRRRGKFFRPACHVLEHAPAAHGQPAM